MADIYDCIFQTPPITTTTTTNTTNINTGESSSPPWTLVDSDISKLLVSVRDGNGEKTVAFQVDKEK